MYICYLVPWAKTRGLRQINAEGLHFDCSQLIGWLDLFYLFIYLSVSEGEDKFKCLGAGRCFYISYINRSLTNLNYVVLSLWVPYQHAKEIGTVRLDGWCASGQRTMVPTWQHHPFTPKRYWNCWKDSLCKHRPRRKIHSLHEHEC